MHSRPSTAFSAQEQEALFNTMRELNFKVETLCAIIQNDLSKAPISARSVLLWEDNSNLLINELITARAETLRFLKLHVTIKPL